MANCSLEALCGTLAKTVELVVLTVGSRGLWLCAQGPPEFHHVVVLEEVVDSTGAGDFFAGGFLSAWLRGESMAVSVAWGSQAATKVLQTFGTDLNEGRGSSLGTLWQLIRCQSNCK